MGFETEQARIDDDDCYFKTLAEELLPKRDALASMLRDVGMTPIIPQGSYFMLADFSQLGERFVGLVCKFLLSLWAARSRAVDTKLDPAWAAYFICSNFCL